MYVYDMEDLFNLVLVAEMRHEGYIVQMLEHSKSCIGLLAKFYVEHGLLRASYMVVC